MLVQPLNKETQVKQDVLIKRLLKHIYGHEMDNVVDVLLVEKYLRDSNPFHLIRQSNMFLSDLSWIIVLSDRTQSQSIETIVLNTFEPLCAVKATSSYSYTIKIMLHEKVMQYKLYYQIDINGRILNRIIHERLNNIALETNYKPDGTIKDSNIGTLEKKDLKTIKDCICTIFQNRIKKTVYEGHLKDGLYDGYGVLYTYQEDGNRLRSKHSSTFKDGKLNGEGSCWIYQPDGKTLKSRYIGHFVNNNIKGQCKYSVYQDDEKKLQMKFEGFIQPNNPYGILTIYQSDGLDVKEQIEYDQNGNGKWFKCRDNKTKLFEYRGLFRNNVPNGKGISYSYHEDGKIPKMIYQGSFKDGMRDGRGEYITYRSDRSIRYHYCGWFFEGKRHGFGISVKYRNNKIITQYVGDFSYDSFCRSGTLRRFKNGTCTSPITKSHDWNA